MHPMFAWDQLCRSFKYVYLAESPEHVRVWFEVPPCFDQCAETFVHEVGYMFALEYFATLVSFNFSGTSYHGSQFIRCGEVID